MSAGIRRTEPGHCTQAQHRAQQKASCFAAGWPRSGSSLLHGIPCVPKSKTTEMRASQQALDWVLDENSSTGPTHSSIRTRGGPAVQQSTSLSTTRHSNLAFSSPNASLMRQDRLPRGFQVHFQVMLSAPDLPKGSAKGLQCC